MMNVLFLIEDQIILSRLESVFVNDKDYSYYFHSQTGDAFETVRDVPIDIAFVSIDSSIMNGAEISDVLFDCNPDVKLIIVYSDEFIEEAIGLFNNYEYSQILNYSNCDPTTLREIIKCATELLNAESTYSRDLSDFREKEKLYKDKMNEVTSALNLRLSCYRNINKLFLESFSYMTKQMVHDTETVKCIFESAFNNYLVLLLDRKVDFEQLYNELPAKYHNYEAKRLFKLSNYIIADNESINGKIVFLLSMICDSYLEFFEMYRGKVEMLKNSDKYVVDIIYDLRMGSHDEDAWFFVSKLIKIIAESLCSKAIVAFCDGIMQYRLVFEEQ